MMIEEWNEEEHAAALKVFAKIEHNTKEWLSELRAGKKPERYPLPHDLYEAHRRTQRGTCAEVGVFNEQKEILLIKRPSLTDAPNEVYPGVWHLPGIRYVVNESESEGLKRLCESEIGAPLTFTPAGHEEYTTNGDYLLVSFLYTAKVAKSSIEETESRKWFDVQNLPTPLLPDHIALIPQLHSRVL